MGLHAMPHPRMYNDSDPAIKRLRERCFALPGVFEKEAWGECTFRVTGGGTFAMTDNNHHDSGDAAVWAKAPVMVQEILIGSDPSAFPRYGRAAISTTAFLTIIAVTPAIC